MIETSSVQQDKLKVTTVKPTIKSTSFRVTEKQKVTTGLKVFTVKPTTSTKRTFLSTLKSKPFLTTQKPKPFLTSVKPTVKPTLQRQIVSFRVTTDKSIVTTGLTTSTKKPFLTVKPFLTSVKPTVKPTLQRQSVNFREIDKSRVTTEKPFLTTVKPFLRTVKPFLTTVKQTTEKSRVTPPVKQTIYPTTTTTQSTATTTSLVRFVQRLSINDVTVLRGWGQVKILPET